VIIILAKADQEFDYQILQLKQEATQNPKSTSHLHELPLALVSGQRD